MTIKVGLVGVGKIARDQHIPVLHQHPGFELIAAASRNASLEGINCYSSLTEMLANEPEIQAVSLCMPPQARYEIACQAIEHGKHVLLEKPPGATLSEVDSLASKASKAGVTLYNSWHSRHASSAETAKSLLANAQIKSVDIQWLEDVRKWHPGQDWIWEPGGLGVFDPGINALSVVTHILPFELRLEAASLSFPENKQSPIAANLSLRGANNVPITACFDWRKDGDQFWNISIESDIGTLLLTDGGNRLFVNGEENLESVHGAYDEYQGVYDLFQNLIENAESNTDCRPLTLTADAFMLGSRETVEAFVD